MSHFIVCMNVGAECSFAMIVNSLWAGSDIIRYSIDEMEQHSKNAVEQKQRLKNILVRIQDLDR